jgi:hypothetical protein
MTHDFYIGAVNLPAFSQASAVKIHPNKKHHQ